MPNKKLTAEIGILIDNKFMDLYWAEGVVDFRFFDRLHRLINQAHGDTLQKFFDCCTANFIGTVMISYWENENGKWEYELSNPVLIKLGL